MSESRVRPGSVTFVVVLTWIYAIVMLINGGLWLFVAGDGGILADLDTTADGVRLYGWTLIIVGLIIALTAIALGRGSRFARFLINALMVLRIALDVWGLIAITGYPLWQGILSILWAALILGLLNNRRSSEWFLYT